MPLNRKAKGSRNERRAKALLEDQGYRCTKAGGSLGVWDLIAISEGRVLLVQVKSNRKPPAAEMETMRAFPCPKDSVTKELWIFHDYQKLPQIIPIY